jgi:hypothetical protein
MAHAGLEPRAFKITGRRYQQLTIAPVYTGRTGKRFVWAKYPYCPINFISLALALTRFANMPGEYKNDSDIPSFITTHVLPAVRPSFQPPFSDLFFPHKPRKHLWYTSADHLIVGRVFVPPSHGPFVNHHPITR